MQLDMIPHCKGGTWSSLPLLGNNTMSSYACLAAWRDCKPQHKFSSHVACLTCRVSGKLMGKEIASRSLLSKGCHLLSRGMSGDRCLAVFAAGSSLCRRASRSRLRLRFRSSPLSSRTRSCSWCLSLALWRSLHTTPPCCRASQSRGLPDFGLMA